MWLSIPAEKCKAHSHQRQHYLGHSLGGAELSDCPALSGDGSKHKTKWIIQQNIAKLNVFLMEKTRKNVRTLGNIKKKFKKEQGKKSLSALCSVVLVAATGASWMVTSWANWFIIFKLKCSVPGQVLLLYLSNSFILLLALMQFSADSVHEGEMHSFSLDRN